MSDELITLDNLKEYDEQIKKYIDNKIAEGVQRLTPLTNTVNKIAKSSLMSIYAIEDNASYFSNNGSASVTTTNSAGTFSRLILKNKAFTFKTGDFGELRVIEGYNLWKKFQSIGISKKGIGTPTNEDLIITIDGERVCNINKNASKFNMDTTTKIDSNTGTAATVDTAGVYTVGDSKYSTSPGLTARDVLNGYDKYFNTDIISNLNLYPGRHFHTIMFTKTFCYGTLINIYTPNSYKMIITANTEDKYDKTTTMAQLPGTNTGIQSSGLQTYNTISDNFSPSDINSIGGVITIAKNVKYTEDKITYVNPDTQVESSDTVIYKDYLTNIRNLNITWNMINAGYTKIFEMRW